MGPFLLRRIVNYLVLITIATCLGYLLAAASLNPREHFSQRQPPPPVASVDATLTELNLNDKTPLPDRFGHWVKGVVTGDLGQTIDATSVSAEMGRRAGVTLRLVVIGTASGALVGVALGFVSAIRQYRPSDHAITFLSFLVLSTPVFLLAVLLKIGTVKVDQAAGTTLLPYTNETTPGLAGGWVRHLTDRAQHLVVPTLSLMLGQAALFSRYQRSAMLDVLGADYIRTARATGMRRGPALVKHGLRTALIPMATLFAYQMGLLLTGVTFTEKIFGWHGMGEWFVDAIGRADVNAVAAMVLFTAVLVLIAGLVSDIAHALLDPRVRV
ncbi:MAG: peptide ABC transporter permease [Catenulispora sp. 13_1_20CM_3_70_7]|jgi:peptide/nickel transport system permease protein|nr:MAG: peptide ABC transporter permease [Catenulispora sp. 13_1_20CM_3_70_7]